MEMVVTPVVLLCGRSHNQDVDRFTSGPTELTAHPGAELLQARRAGSRKPYGRQRMAAAPAFAPAWSPGQGVRTALAEGGRAEENRVASARGRLRYRGSNAPQARSTREAAA